eukprot:1158048-Pelagomonas_calceolata.AAC.6
MHPMLSQIRNMPKLQHVVAQDLRPPPHRSRQEAAAIAGEWVVAVEERRKRQQYRNKRKRERGSLGQVRAGAGQAGPLSTAQAGGESAGASAGVPAGREGGGQAALSIATEGNGPWGGDQAGACAGQVRSSHVRISHKKSAAQWVHLLVVA